ncbi:MAG: ATP-binding protein [Caldisericaceae bacterium]|nr:ATP-binding protein [Caldisericaceae bacterium]
MRLLKKGKYQVIFPSNIKYLPEAEHITACISKELAFDEDARDDLSIAITELFNNALHHGNKEDESKKITITFTVLGEGLQISVQDEGKGFKPEKIKNPLDKENILKTSGRGLFLVEQLVDKICFNVSQKGSEVIVFKKFNK